MHTLEYSVGDLVCLNAGHVVHCYDDVNCDSGPANPTRFGLTVNDYVPAIILDMKEDPEFVSEAILQAIVDASEQAKTKNDDAMSGLTGGMQMPGLF